MANRLNSWKYMDAYSALWLLMAWCSVATDGLVLKHQAISIHSADCISFLLDRFHSEYYIYGKQH